jgi:hypothetical protein
MRFFVPMGTLWMMSCDLQVLFPAPAPATGTGTTPSTPSDSADSAAPPWVHDPVPEGTLCWTCHEADRVNPEHYGDANQRLAWDCAPCHDTVAWDDAPILHQVRIPHGTYDNQAPTIDSEWIVSCSACHPVSGVFTDPDCATCHADLDPSFFPHLGLTESDPGVTSFCITCHETGDIGVYLPAAR